MSVSIPGRNKRYPLNMRTTKDLREKMEAAARESGRSLVQEVEYRLERSFRDDEVLAAIAALRYGGDGWAARQVETMTAIDELAGEGFYRFTTREDGHPCG